MSSIQQSLIDLCCHYAAALSLPRSVGHTYGVLFASEKPLCFDEIQAISGISRGGVSQALRFLRDYGAVQVVKIEGDRRDFYEPVLALRKVLTDIFRDRLEPALQEGSRRIKSLPENLPESEILTKRIGALRSWNSRSRLPLAVLEKVLKI